MVIDGVDWGDTTRPSIAPYLAQTNDRCFLRISGQAVTDQNIIVSDFDGTNDDIAVFTMAYEAA